MYDNDQRNFSSGAVVCDSFAAYLNERNAVSDLSDRLTFKILQRSLSGDVN
jgi:hypothetical protein